MPHEPIGIYVWVEALGSIPLEFLFLLEGRSCTDEDKEETKEGEQMIGDWTPGSIPLTTCVTAQNWIHACCHSRAAAADSSMETPRSEWAGAALRNARVGCNSLLP
eukprot:CAMPEP_0194695860 /NCGR_PEP_ID=MMETSP0295-20121207/22268_1 /TAXON_ID=39354 /ORGANISM="Heterosigma akashiwo, Strain CCMP2393" /LENGTH=105 /DNA_ID=CAMNT_0039587793 /DNA_START=82 /DNA_END=396 /DNA_ORIENTATION=+